MAFTITNPFNVTDAGDLELNGARHVATAVVGGITYLFTTGSDDSGVSVFSMAADGTLTNVHNVPDNGTLRLGGAFGAATAVVDGTTYLIASGLNDSGLSVFSVGADGSLTNTDNVGDTVALQLGSAVDVQTAVVGGTTYVFAAGNTDHGISVFSLGTNGTLTNVDNVNDVESAAFRLSGVQGMTTAVVGGTTYLFAAGFHDSGVSVFSVGADGVLTNAANVGDSATLELGGAVGVTTAVVGGTTYLFVAGFNDDGVSVFSVGTNGTLTNVDNVTDAGALELDNAIYLTTAVVGGTTYLFVTGSDDDGMSVFSVGTDGHLTSVTNVVDNATLELDRAYRPTTVTVGGNTFVVVPGQHDDGLSVFRVFDDSNTAPTADAVGPVNGIEDSGARIAIALSGNDTDPADAVESFTIQTLAANGQLFDAATGGNLLGAGSIVPATGSGPWTATVYFQPNADFNGATSFTYSAFDGVANSTAATASITVTAQADTVADDLTTSEGVAVTANVLTGNNGASADNFEGAAVLVDVTSGANGTVGFDAAGNVTYTPNADFFGTDTFTYTVASGGVTETGTVNVTVTEVNDAPIAGDDALSAVDEDSGTRIIAIADLIGNDLKGPTNEAAQALDIIDVGNAVGGTVQINGGNIEFALDPNFNGTASFDYTLRDNGTTNGEPDPLTAGGHVSFAVNPVNDAPSFTPGQNQAVAEDAGAQTVVAWPSNISAGPADEAGQILQFGVTNDNNALFSVQPFISDDGTLTYTPAANASGTATLSVTLADSGGDSVTQQFTITVTEANDAPTAGDDTLSAVDEDSGTRVIAIADLIGNDLEGPANEAAQGLDIVNVGNAVGGTVQINGGNIEFTLDPNFNGTASFDYTLQDDGTTNGQPDPLTDIGHVSFAVNPINDAPTFVSGVDVVLVNEDSGTVSTAWASDMLAGPADESGQALNFNITLTGTTGNLAFTAMPAIDPLTGTLSFEAAANTNGTATVEVTLVDDGAKVPPHVGESLTQTFAIVVDAVNDAPEFSDLNNVVNNIEGDGPTVLEEDAELSDLELDAADSYAGATLTLQRQGGASADDVFGATGILAFNGSDVVVGTTTVGTLTNAGGVLTITFNADATADLVDEVLQHITYRNTSDAPPAQFAIAYTFSDGNTGTQGSGGARTVSGSITVNIEAVNDDPAATGVPSDIIVTENVASNLDLSAITLTDPDSGDADITLMLTASAGILAATSGGGVAVGGAGTGVLTLTGAIADIDAFLNVASNIQYTLNAAGDDVATVTLTANDGGNVALGTVNIDSDGVNDDPAATGVPSDVTVVEDVASNLDLSAITLTDPDSGASPITLTLAATAGILAAVSGGGVTVGGSGTGTLTLTGAVANIDAYLNGAGNIQYTTALNQNGDNAATIELIANDGGNTGTGGGDDVALGTIQIDATAVNDVPTATGVPSDVTVVEDVASNLDLSAITLTDPDSGATAITMTLAANAGVLAAASGGGVTVGGSGTGALTLTGTVANIDAFLNVASHIQYTTALDVAGNNVASLALTANDGSGDVALGTVNIDATAINDNPTGNVGGLPSDIAVTEDVASNLDLSAIALVDVDAGANPITLRLTASAGTLAAASGGGVMVAGAGTGILTLTGAVANIDAFLNVASNIQYTTALNAAGNNVATVALTANDGGNTGLGGGTDVALGSVNIDATAVNDNPGGNLAGGASLYLENQAPTALDPTLTVTDADDTHMEGATAQITANFAAGQDVLGFVNQNGITGNYHAGTGLLTLTGHATLAQYEAALRSVTYFNSSDTPATIARNVHFAVDDGGGLTNFGDVGVNLTGVNDTPVLADVPASTSYGRGEPAVVLAAGATVADLDTPTLDGATVRITNVQAGDVLDAEPGGINILVAYDPVTGTLTLSGTDTLANYQQVLATVVFSTTSPGASRTLEWQLDDGEAAGSLSTVVNSQITLGDTARNDFDADGRSDLFWRDDAGVLVLWDMDGATVTGNHVLSAAMPDPSQVLDIADFNGDGRNDVLWQNQAGAMMLWEIDGATITSEAVVANTPLPSYWHYEGTGDFTGDGNSDILWRDDAGVLVLWEMDGADVTGNHVIGNIGADWHVAEIADFNGDTRSDILWRHDDGTVRLWEMDGSTVIGDTTLGTFAAYWEIVDSGDYNGDGNADLLWRDDAGVVVMWELNGPAILDNTVVATVPAAMQLVNSGDYNGDGNADLLWRDGATVSLWEMDGPNVLAQTNVATIPTYWHIQ